MNRIFKKKEKTNPPKGEDLKLKEAEALKESSLSKVEELLKESEKEIQKRKKNPPPKPDSCWC